MLNRLLTARRPFTSRKWPGCLTSSARSKQKRNVARSQIFLINVRINFARARACENKTKKIKQQELENSNCPFLSVWLLEIKKKEGEREKKKKKECQVREATLATKKRGNAQVWERKSQLNLSVDILLLLHLLHLLHLPHLLLFIFMRVLFLKDLPPDDPPRWVAEWRPRNNGI